MNYDDRIVFLKQTHEQLKKEIKKAIANNEDPLLVAEMKKNKLHVKDSLDKMTKLDIQGREFK